MRPARGASCYRWVSSDALLLSLCMGASLTYARSMSLSVTSMATALQTLTGIAPQAQVRRDIDSTLHSETLSCAGHTSTQLLLCDGIRLDMNQALGAYGLPRGDNGAVFLYDRALMRPGASVPVVPEPDFPLACDDPAPVSDGDPASMAADTAAASAGCPSSLEFYMRRFGSHAACARALQVAGFARYKYASATVAELHVSSLALEAARQTVAHHRETSAQSHAAWETDVAAALDDVDRQTCELDASLQACKRTPLHSAVALRLGVGSGASLADVMPIDSLVACASSCTADSHALRSKLFDLNAAHAYAQSYAEELLVQPHACDLDVLRVRCEQACDLVETLARVAATFDGDAITAQRLAADAPKGPPALSAADAAAALMAVHGRHVLRLLPQARTASSQLRQLAEACLAAKRGLAMAMTTQLYAVQQVQTNLSSLRTRRAALTSATQCLAENCRPLSSCALAPSAYAAALAEAARRRASALAFAASAAQAAERLGAARSDEQAARDAWTSAASGVLPPRLLTAMGLDLPPPMCEVSVKANDSGACPLAEMLPDELRRMAIAALEASQMTSSGRLQGRMSGTSSVHSSSGVPSPRRRTSSIGAMIIAAITRRSSADAVPPPSASTSQQPSSMLSALLAGSSTSAGRSGPSGLQGDLSASGRSLSASWRGMPTTGGSRPPSPSPSQSQSLEVLQLRADLATAVAALTAMAAGHVPGPDLAHNTSSTSTLQAALFAKDAVCDALRTQLDALTLRSRQLEEALAKRGDDEAQTET